MARAQQKPAPQLAPEDDDEDEPAKDAAPRDAAPSGNSNHRRGRLTKRFALPPGCAVREVVIRELDGLDELIAAGWVEMHTPASQLETIQGQMAAEQRELMRLSLVEVDGEEVNNDGVPYKGMDSWTMKTFRSVRVFFSNVNTVDDMALSKAIAAAEVVQPGPAAANGRGSARGG